MVVTLAVIMQRASRRVGARVGTIGSGTARTAVLNGLINSLGEDESYDGWRLIMPQATAEADKEKFVDDWEDATGTAHFIARATDTDLAGEIYILMPPEGYTLNELRDAAKQTFRETSRTYRHTLPLYDSRTIPLSPLTWVTGDASVDAVFLSDNPSLIHNNEMGLWQEGDSAAPDGWTLAGSGATVARASNGIRSAYAATLTRVTNDATLYQSLLPAYQQSITRNTTATLPTLYAGAWVVCSAASRARIGITLNGGSSTTYSSYHSGTAGLPEWLSTSLASTAAATDIRLVLSVDTGDASATFHYADIVAQAFPTELKDNGNAAYRMKRVNYRTRNEGGVPVVELMTAQSGRQLVTYSRRFFAETDADTDEIEDQHARAIEAGLVAKLLQNRKPNQDRTRLDVVMDEEQRIWNRMTNNFNDIPVPDPPMQVSVMGA